MSPTPEQAKELPNGPAAAAILAAGAGMAALGVFAVAGDASKAIARLLIFYRPTGPLSGVTSSAIIVWLAVWYGLSRRWGNRQVAFGTIAAAALGLLLLGLLLTFPPFADLLEGK